MYRTVQFALVVAMATLPARMIRAAPVPASGPDAPRVVVYPSAGQANDSRGNYYVSLLRLALARSDAVYEVRPSTEATVTRRALVEMAAGRGIDVLWAPRVTTLDHDFLPVPIPLDHGILGWRIFLIDKRDSAVFAAIRSLEQLKAYSAGQVGEWADTAIMRANGIPVVDTTLYENLFPMLAAHRFSYLPRGIAEIDGEARNYAALGLVIEPRLALHYPYCTCFYVRRQNRELARQIETGLRRVLKDGSMEALFQQFNGPAIQRAALARRVVFELANPLAVSDQDAWQQRCSSSSSGIVPGR